MKTPLILFGLEHSGITTQALLLEQKLNIPHLSIYQLLIQYSIQKQQNRSLDDSLDSPTDFVLETLKTWLEQADVEHGWILTEYPTTPTQAQQLDASLECFNLPQPQALYLNVPQQILPEQLHVMSGLETEDSLATKLQRSCELVNPLMKYYQTRNRLIVVDSQRVVEVMHARLLQVVQCAIA